MWSESYCPLCKKELVAKHSKIGDPMYYVSCPTRMELPEGLKLNASPLAIENSTATHFEMEVKGGRTHYEQAKIWPYSICSYDDETNFYKIDNILRTHFIVAVPYVQLPWDDVEKIKAKIQTYSVFI